MPIAGDQAGVAELADALVLGTSVLATWGFKSPRLYEIDNSTSFVILVIRR